MHLFEVYRGQWALTPDGDFKPDPWYIVAGTEIVDSGFGRPPQEFTVRQLPEGVVLPGLVNSHTHCELSWLKGRLTPHRGLMGMAREIAALREGVTLQEMTRAANDLLEAAYQRGTFFFNDICNDPQFIAALPSAPSFFGNRFFEILGFSPPKDKQRIAQAKQLLENDPNVLPTIHSAYGSSPEVMRFVREKARFTTMSLHLLEAPDEMSLPQETGEVYQFLCDIGQYRRYSELYHVNLLEYLFNMGMLSFKKLLMVHLLHARDSEIDFLSEHVPHNAWVLCQRSNEFLGYTRQNWQALLLSPMRMLIGTDSAATAPDLSVIDELAAIARLGVVPESTLLKAATWSAYEYLEIRSSRIPYFLFKGAEPNIASLAAAREIEVLRG